MEVTELGIVTDVRLLHPLKAHLPMEVTELGMATEVRLLQPRKDSLPMEVTELGMVTEVRPVHSKKALPPMLVTDLGISIDVIFTQPLNAALVLVGIPVCLSNSAPINVGSFNVYLTVCSPTENCVCPLAASRSAIGTSTPSISTFVNISTPLTQ